MPLVITEGLSGSLLITEGFGGSNAPVSGFNLVSITNSGSQLTLTFTEPLHLIGSAATFSSYTITGGPYPAVVVISLSVTSNVLTLGTSLQHGGGTYTLDIPALGFAAASGNAYVGTLTPVFTGVAPALGILMARMVNARTLEVIFERAVNIWDAEAAGNYLLSGTGAGKVVSITKVAPIIYRMTTSRQSVSKVINYTITASGIHDTQGNLIG